MASLNAALERIAERGSAIGAMVENIRTMSSDTQRIEKHSAHLDSIDERIDRIVELMEGMVSSVEELSGTVAKLDESLEPVSRLAGRFPGGTKRNADD